MTARRSCLSVPGSAPQMLAKAAALVADELVLDLEDAVPTDGKDGARERVAATLASGSLAGRTVAVRVNGLGTPWCHRDVVLLVERAGSAVQSFVRAQGGAGRRRRVGGQAARHARRACCRHPVAGAHRDSCGTRRRGRDRRCLSAARCADPRLCRPVGVPREGQRPRRGTGAMAACAGDGADGCPQRLDPGDRRPVPRHSRRRGAASAR